MTASLLLTAYQFVNYKGRSRLFGVQSDHYYRMFHSDWLDVIDMNHRTSACRFETSERIAAQGEAYFFSQADGSLGGDFLFTSCNASHPHENLPDFRTHSFDNATSGIMLVNALASPFEQRTALGERFLALVSAMLTKIENTGDYVAGGGGLGAGGYGVYFGTPEFSWVGGSTADSLWLYPNTTYARLTIPLRVTIDIIFGFTDDYACSITFYMEADRTAHGTVPTLSVVPKPYITVESGHWDDDVRSGLQARAEGMLGPMQEQINSASIAASNDAMAGFHAQHPDLQVALGGVYLLPGNRTDRSPTVGTGSCDDDVTLVARYHLV